MNNSVLRRIIKKFFNSKDEVFIFWIILSYYFILWYLNPGNKIIAASFVVLTLFLYIRLINIRISLLVAYLASLIVSTGKYYLIELVPPGIFSKELFPLGHVSAFVISPPIVLSAIMAVILFRDFILGEMKDLNFKFYDYALITYIFWLIISDILGSSRPEVSLLYSTANLQVLVLFIFVRSYIRDTKKFIYIFVGLICAQIIFESVISFHQFFDGSPIYKNIEASVDIGIFGRAQDELYYRFRPIGTFRHANLFGLWLSFWLSVIIVALYKNRNMFFFTVFILGLTVLIMTLSRSSWLGYTLSFMFSLYVLEKMKKKKIPNIVFKNSVSLTVLFLILFIFFVLPRAEKSLYTFSDGGGYFRYEQIEEAVLLVTENPIFGVGSAMSVPEGIRLNPKGYFSQNPLSIHNWYMVLLSEHGIPAFIFFMLFIVFMLRSNLLLIKNDIMSDNSHYLRLSLTAGVMSLLIIGYFQPYIGDTLIVMTSAILGVKSYGKS